MKTFLCPKKCCKIVIKPYELKENVSFKEKNYKTGVFIYDRKKDKILLVQSRGNLWGHPKGSLKYNENIINGALREVKEETNLNIQKFELSKKILIKNEATYFYLEKHECDVNFDNKVYDNDVNGITWIKTDCLYDCINKGNITLNKHFILTFNKFMRKNIPKSNFILIKKSR
jgi:hypothetical protein